MMRPRLLIFDSSRGVQRFLKKYLYHEFDIHCVQKKEQLEQLDLLFFDVVFIHVNHLDDLVPILYFISHADTIVLGYSKSEFDYVLDRLETVYLLDLQRNKKEMLENFRRILNQILK